MAPRYRRELWLAMSEHLDVEFWCDTKEQRGIKPIDLTQEKISHQQLTNISIRGVLIWQVGAIGRLLANKRRIEAVIILGEVNCLSSWLIILLCKLLSIPTCVWTHGLYGNESELKRKMRVSLCKLGSHVLTYERRARQLLIDSGIHEKRVSVIFNSLHYNRQLDIRARLCPDKKRVLRFFENPESRCLLFIGRLTTNKRLDLLVEAFSRLPTEFALLFIGDGPMLRQLRSKLEAEITAGRVFFTGAMYNEEEIAPLIYNSDLCVSPGNVGLTCIHALSYGTPVATHNDMTNQMPEAEAISHNENGFFFEHGSVDSLEESILKWFSEDRDREVLRQDCYREVDLHYNPNYQIKVFTEVLEKLRK